MKLFVIFLLVMAVASITWAQSPIVVGQDGQYLGKLSANRYDSDSISNPYGQYGSRYSSTSINNPYSQYGSRYSDLSATNPYASRPPLVISPAPSYGYGLYNSYPTLTPSTRYQTRFPSWR